MSSSVIVEENLEAIRANFENLLNKSFQTSLAPGSIVLGEILKIEKDGLLVDIGGKSEGFAMMKEIPGCFSQDDLQQNFTVGHAREFFILREFDEEVQFLLSIRRVAAFKSWDRLLELKEANETVEATVTGITKGGILVNILDLKGFIPASQLRVAKTLNNLVGEVLPAKILEVDKSKNKLILSHRLAIFEQKAAMRSETLNKLKEGDVVSGEIVKITDFGVFVDINGIDGLLPLSEITWRRIKHPSEVLELGQKITVSVLTVDTQLQRISLSLKRLDADPWNTVTETFKVNDKIVGKVSKLLSSGILAELVPGVEAYCAYEAGGKFYYVGESYNFEIVSISVPDRKITLEFRGDI